MSDEMSLAEIEIKSEVFHIDDANKRLRLLFLYQIMLKYSNAETPLSTLDIIRLMKKIYHIDMHRTTVPKDIALLKIAGCDVSAIKSRPNKYFIEAQVFEIPEIKILIDAVESSHMITEKKSKALVNKILSLTSETNAQKLKRNIKCTKRVRSNNEKIYYIVDAINDAINENKKIRFFYTGYNQDKQLYIRNSGNPYIVSPYSLVWNGDYYYLVGWDHQKEKVCHYRIDRIKEQPEVIQESAKKYQRTLI